MNWFRWAGKHDIASSEKKIQLKKIEDWIASLEYENDRLKSCESLSIDYIDIKCKKLMFRWMMHNEKNQSIN
jgi:hypothetical protein